MTFYFIDLENTGEAWTKSVQDHMPGDTIFLFYSKNYMRVAMDSIGPYLEAGVLLKCRKCNTGRNGLDFQLCSELGYQAAMNRDALFVVVSRDTGYDVLISYWNRQSVRVGRRAPALPGSAKPSKKVEQAGAAQDPPDGRVLSRTQCRKVYHQRLRTELGPLHVTESELNKLIGHCLIASGLEGKKQLNYIYRGCLRDYGRKRAIELYGGAKPVIERILAKGPFPHAAGD